MSGHDAFERILASLYDARLDDVHWPDTTALIDEACGSTSNVLMIGEGPKDDIRVLTVGLYYQGQRREDLEREYLEVYHPKRGNGERRLALKFCGLKCGAKRSNRGFLRAITGIIGRKHQFRAKSVLHEHFAP